MEHPVHLPLSDPQPPAYQVQVKNLPNVYCKDQDNELF